MCHYIYSSSRLPKGAKLRGILRKLHIFYGFMLDDERYSAEDIEQMEALLFINNLTIPEFVEHLRWNCDEILYRCRFNGEIMDCSKIFQLSKTFSAIAVHSIWGKKGG